MADPVRVDVHMHLYPSAESGDWWKAGYEIWEYGEKQGVRFSRSSGTVGDALAAMEKAGFSHGVAVNLLSVDLFREEADRGAAVLLTLHDLPLAARTCDRLVVLAEGRVVGEAAGTRHPGGRTGGAVPPRGPRTREAPPPAPSRTRPRARPGSAARPARPRSRRA